MQRKAIAVSLVFVLMTGVIGCGQSEPPQAPSAAPSPSKTEDQKPTMSTGDSGKLFKESLPNEIAAVNGISVALSRQERYDGGTYLYFAFRKVDSNATDFDFKPVVVDDRGNEYRAWAQTIFQGWNIKSLPIGFTWVNKYTVEVPNLAPIEKVVVLNRQILLRNFEPMEPDLGMKLEDCNLSMGDELFQGRHLKWNVKQIAKENGEFGYSFQDGLNPIINRWTITIEVENLDYNSHRFYLPLKMQAGDGTFARPRYGIHTLAGYDDTYVRNGKTWVVGAHLGYVAVDVPAQSRITTNYYFPEKWRNNNDSILNLMESEPRAVLVLNFPEEGRNPFSGASFYSTYEDGKAYILEVAR